LSAWNTLVQLLALYTDHESHNAQPNGQTDDIIMPIADRGTTEDRGEQKTLKASLV